jgi:polysaccharide biosynthesis/export protein
MVLVLAGNTVAQDAAAKAAAVPTPPETLVAGSTSKSESYRIGFQDILEIRIDRHPDLAQRRAVRANGTIELFRLERPLVAVCKTESELAADIAAAYEKNYLVNPQVQVTVADQRSQSVTVIGAVEKPNTYFINRRYHLLEMLAMAGGPNKEAGTRLIVARTGSTTNCRDKGDETDGDNIAVMAFKIADVREGRKSLWMQPGDVVYVLDADIVYIYGNVNKQGSLKIREPITLTQAIASAEGFKPAAKKDKIRVLRQVEGTADRLELVFDMAQIDKGQVKDPFLEPNDIVAVSQDKAKAILRGIVDSLKSTIPGMTYRVP